MSKQQKEYPIDPRSLDDILWELLIKEHELFDEFLYDSEGKVYMKKRSGWLKQWFIDLKSKLLEPISYEQAKESPQKTEKTTGITGKKRNYH